MCRLVVEGISLAVEPRGGMLADLVIERNGHRLAPLHRAPWVQELDAMPADAAPHLAVLEGDFFCAPFGRTDDPAIPAHGWPANGRWQLEGIDVGADGSKTGRFELPERVNGAVVSKEMTLRPGHPVVYQRHVLRGGSGRVPIAHHAMIRVPGGARVSFSPKDFGATPTTPQESDPARGRSLLAYPQRFDSLADVGLVDGRRLDLSRYPWAETQEDFLTLFDPQAARVGWSAAVAKVDGFVFFAVKDASVLTQTSLWMSNGGRSYAPWSSRHLAVLGIEETCAHFGDGPAVSGGDNDLSRQGYRTAVTLGGRVDVRYALGAIPVPDGWSEVMDITVGGGKLVLTDVSGRRETVPFDPEFLGDR
ncbi:MAG: hypothetical protein QM699_11195 [Amaricoccus sp.]|uniref:hypothetical protein n=1 Tax=Amaricoccus sp. TaxID=1872485 RepID=UPI0039E36AC7